MTAKSAPAAARRPPSSAASRALPFTTQPSASPGARERSGRWIVFALSALALFACVWLTRVFVAADLVAQWKALTGIRAIAAIAVVGGLLPSVVLGIVYGAFNGVPVARRALAVAAAACALELGFASLSVTWWLFLTWWVLPVECVAVLIVFPCAAVLGARLRRRRV